MYYHIKVQSMEDYNFDGDIPYWKYKGIVHYAFQIDTDRSTNQMLMINRLRELVEHYSERGSQYYVVGIDRVEDHPTYDVEPWETVICITNDNGFKAREVEWEVEHDSDMNAQRGDRKAVSTWDMLPNLGRKNFKREVLNVSCTEA